MKEWSVLAEHTKKLRKYKHRKDTKSKYIFFQKLKQTIAQRKFKLARLNYVISRYEK
jgi:hypothetical protein